MPSLQPLSGTTFMNPNRDMGLLSSIGFWGENGYPYSIKRVQRYMAAQNLRSVTCRKYRPQSSKTEIPEHENVLNQEFFPDTICQKWCILL